VVPSELIELGQQALAAASTSVARGAPLVQCQLLASEFYEALKDELRETSPTAIAGRRACRDRGGSGGRAAASRVLAFNLIA
jgi:hypothetical protein